MPSVPSSPRADSFLSKRVLLASAALIAAIVVVYAPVRHFGFVMWDDPEYVVDNGHVAQGLTWQGGWWALTSTDAFNWHPVTWLSHMLDVQLYGMNAGPQHVTSLFIHILNTLLLFGLLYFMTAALGRSMFVAGLFAVHPLHVESVAWIAERKDVLSTLFGILTMWAYVAYVRRLRWGRYWLVLVLLGLGLMAKPMLVTLPFVLLLLDVWPLQRVELGDAAGLLRLLREKLPLLALAAVSSVVTVLAQQSGGAVAGLERVPLSLRLANAPASYLAYIGKMLWPVRLAAFYPLGTSAPVLQASIGALLLIGVTILAIRAGQRHGYFLVGWLWYVGTLIPVIGLVQVGGQSMADRYTYVPLIGLFLIVAWGAPELVARWRYGRLALPAVAACVLLACATLAKAQVRYWTDTTALWRHALEVAEDNYLAHNNLGGILLKQGRAGEAITHFAEALRIRPHFVKAEANLGMALMEQGKLDGAEQRFVEALRIEPGLAEAHSGLGKALAGQGRLSEAIAQYTEALRLRPGDAETRHDLGKALAEQERVEEAIAQYTEALRLKANFAEAQADLGMALMWQGRVDEAAQHFTEAVRIKPDFAEAHAGLGNALAGEGRVNEAVAQYTEALRLRPGDAEAHNDLGVALGRQGRLDEAEGHFIEALRIKPGFADASENLKLAQSKRGKSGQH
jgi:Flp pilus assembly protein TadD